MDEEQARRTLEQALRAGLVDAPLARRALDVMREAQPAGRAAALAALGLAPQVVAALAGPLTPRPTPRSTPRPSPTTPASTPRPEPAPGLGSTVRLPGRDRPVGGTKLGPFTVEGELGRGGMGVVLRARHEDGRPAAVKLLLEGSSAASAARFQREVQALAALDHPNVVKLLGASPEGQLPPWLAMAFVEGEDLDKRLARGPLPPDEAARLLAEVALGVAHAHRRGVVHRDLKPSNILVRPGHPQEAGRAVVTDFGLAKALDGSRLTRTGSMVGTLSFMAPEQVTGKADVGAPADVWALGAILYRALSGRDPFVEESAMALAAAICAGGPPPLRKVAPGVPADLERVALSCLALDPAARPTAAQVAAALRDRRRPDARRAAPLVAGLAALVLAAGLLVVLTPRGPPPGPSTATPAPTTAATPPGPGELEPGSPWPAMPEGWSLAWSAGRGPPAAPVEPALWRGADEAAPVALAREGAPGALAAAFAGEAAALGGGRVRVRHASPASSLSVDVPNVGHLTGHGDPRMTLVEERGPGAARALAANDSSGIVLRVGEARWGRARIALDVRLVEHVDNDNVWLDLGVSDLPGAPAPRRLGAAGRSATLRLGPAPEASVPFRLGTEFVRLAFAPGADLGERVRLDGQAVGALDLPAAGWPPAGRVELLLQEAHVELRALELEGLPLTVDWPALARPPLAGGEAGSRAAAGVRFTEVGEAPGAGAEDAPDGGPFVTLGEGPRAVRVEVDGARVLLREGARLLAAADDLPAPPASGWLWLARDVDRLRAVVVAVVAGAEHRRELTALHPLPLRTGVPGWGSTGRAVRLSGGALWVGPEEPARAAFDAAPEGSTPDDGPADAHRAAAVRWRRGALALARCADPEWSDQALVGPEAVARRVERARAAADDLDAAAAGLADAALRLDARARALLARVLALEADPAAGAARALVDEAGLERARAAVDALERERGRPVLVERLVDGYTTVADVPLRDAALRAALVLAPDAAGRITVGLAGNIRARVPKPDPATPEGRAALEGAIALYERARAMGLDPKLIDAPEGDTYADLGRLDDALARFEACTRHSPEYWWGWLRGGHCLARLGRPVEALERTLGALACAVTRRDIQQSLLELLSLEQVQGEAPGLASVALVFLGAALGPTDPAAADRLQADAQGLAERAIIERARADRRDFDLAVHALQCLGLRAPVVKGDRPTALLVRARAGEEVPLQAARAADRLVDTLVRLEPTLAGR